MPGATRMIKRYATVLVVGLSLLVSGTAAWGGWGAAPGAEPAPKKTPELPPDAESSRGTVDLRPKFVEGRESKYTMKSTSTSVQEPLKKPKGKDKATQRTETTLELEIGLTLRTTKVNEDGSAEMELVFTSYDVHNKHNVDTKQRGTQPSPKSEPDDSDPAIQGVLDAIVGTTLALHVDTKGNITGLTGGEALSSLLGGATGGTGGMGGNSGAGMFNWIGGSATDGNAGTRKIGDRWTNRDKLSEATPLGGFDMVTTHTLRRLRGSIAEVEFSSVIESAASPGKPKPTNQVQQAGAKGKYLWDTQRGELQQLASSQTSTITSGDGDDAQNISSTQTVSVERK